MNRIALTVSSLALALGTTLAGSAEMKLPPPTYDPGQIPSGTYTLDKSHTQVVFSILHMGISPYYGRITGASGTMTLDAAHVEKSSLNVALEMKTISATVTELDGILTGAKVFDAAKFPQAAFRSTSIRSTGAKTADITGNMTIHGVTKPVTLHATFTGAMQMPWANNAWDVGFAVTGRIKRSDFGLNDPMLAVESDTVDLLIEAEFAQKL